MEELYSAKTKWYNLGMRLGLQPAVLDAIQTRCQQDPETCLGEMLEEVLRQGKCSSLQEELIQALRSTTVGEPVLATKLEAKYYQIVGMCEG